MPCYRCGTRQVDPDRGSSPWLRGVRADRQVLICPLCQLARDWTADLDRCPLCASIRLVRRLGEVECRDCGAVAESAMRSDPAPGAPAVRALPETVLAEESVPPGLAQEVEQALARVLRPASRAAPIG